MSFHSKVILWLQNDAYFLFNYELNSKSFTLFKTYGTNENPRCIAKDLSQIGVERLAIYFCHRSGYLLDGDLSLTKSQLLELIRDRDITIKNEDLLRCQAVGNSVYIQVLESNILSLWQNAMDEFKVLIDNFDFPEQACLNLLPNNLKRSGCFLSIGNIQGNLNMQWEFRTTEFKLDPIKWGISLKSSELLHPTLPNVINKELLNGLDFRLISEHACPVYNVEEAWELNFSSEDIRDSRCTLLRASFESPLSVKALRTWGQTCIRIAASLTVLLILVQLATPKSDQQYAVVTEDLISQNSDKFESTSNKSISNAGVQSKLSSNLKELWAGIEKLKSNAKRLTQKSVKKTENHNISAQLPLVMPILNYLNKSKNDSCGEFQLGLQKLDICEGQSIFGKKLLTVNKATSTWIDHDEKKFYIARVNRVQELKTRVVKTSGDSEYLVELISDNSKSLIVDSWEGQPLKSKREAEIVAEAIATGILSGDRLETTPAHSEAQAGLSSLHSSKL